MTPALPARGSVIRYAYLWADEEARGQQEGRKDRPAFVLALSVRSTDGKTEVLALAITRTAPADPFDAIPVPPNIKRRIGLDDAPSWIVTTEANVFVWPGPDIRPVPGRTPATAIYRRVPDSLLKGVAVSYLANRRMQRSRNVIRTE